MPNHMHAIIWILDTATGEASATLDFKIIETQRADASPIHKPIGTRSGSSGAIIQNFKSISTRKINQWIRESGKGEAFATSSNEIPKSILANASPQQLWQRNYYEHIVRNQLELDRICEYIADNPRQWAEDLENPEKVT